MIPHRFLASVAITFLLAIPQAALAQAFTSGAGSMRIDVEVYKGPLARDIRTQLAEFLGLLQQTESQFHRIEEQMSFWEERIRTERQDSKAKETPAFTIQAKFCQYPNVIDAYECRILLRLLDESKDLNKSARILPVNLQNVIEELNDERTLTSDDKGKGQRIAKKIRDVAINATAFAKRISRSAQNWQELQTAVVVPSEPLRALMTSFQFAASEQANQIASRADALIQQIDGLDRRELPLSAFISGSAPTDFARLFEWNDAYLYAPNRQDWFGNNVEDRVKILERLQADMHWARVNTVYASGRGDTGMAFIKDDIGNWSLKQFDNDPTELLQAYSGIAKAALAQAGSLITTVTSGGSTAGIKQLVGLADALAFGNSGAPEQARAPVDLQPARDRLAARLKNIHEIAAAKEAAGADKAELRKSVEADIRNALETYKATLDLLDEATPSGGGSPLPTGPLDALKGQLPNVPIR